MLNIEKYKDDILEKYESDITCCVRHVCSGEESCMDDCSECKKYAMQWLLSEYKEPILNKAERKYLSDVIRPFRKSVTYISKLPFSETDRQFISIVIMNERGRRECVNLPNFETDTMYKGVKPNKPYTLEELGL